MNRIYQGRVTRIEAKNSVGNFNPTPFGRDQSSCPLWRHHSVFQDAVNYYLLALASMAKVPVQNADRLMTDLPKRIGESWEIPQGFCRALGWAGWECHAGRSRLRDFARKHVGLSHSFICPCLDSREVFRRQWYSTRGARVSSQTVRFGVTSVVSF